MNTTATTSTNATRLLVYAPLRKLLAENGAVELNSRPSPNAPFAEDLRVRENTPFKFERIGYSRAYGINE